MADAQAVAKAAGAVDAAPRHLPAATTRTLVALIVGQICLHSCMTGVRLAGPLQVLRQSHSAWAVGVLLGLFAAAPVLLALHAGRLADRHGYHRPLQTAVGLTMIGGVFAVLSTLPVAAWPGAGFALLCVRRCSPARARPSV